MNQISPEGKSDGAESIQADSNQAVDGGRAESDVGRDEDLADRCQIVDRIFEPRCWANSLDFVFLVKYLYVNSQSQTTRDCKIFNQVFSSVFS